MFFDINDDFVSSCPGSLTNGYKVKIHIWYYDIGHGTWKLKYRSTVSGNISIPITNTNNNSGLWKDTTVIVTDAKFDNGFAHGADIIINYSGFADPGETDPIFHMIEITKNPPN